MTQVDRWLLPEGLDELLPEQAAALETLRRDLLDSFRSRGYQLVRPPMIEYLEALKVGTGNDLALQTFTLTDQLSGRLLGLRADLTPQVARMDAHSLKREGPSRLCYCAPVLHSTAKSLGESREQDQIGIELFGSNSTQADIEVIELMIESVAKAGAFDLPGDTKLDLGNVSIYRTAARFAQLNQAEENELCDILQRKAQPELKIFVAEKISSSEAAELILCLPSLCGSAEVLEKARGIFEKVSDASVSLALLEALNEILTVYQYVQQNFQQLECYFDLSELRGYDYHTGLVFAVYQSGRARSLAKGGRYDSIGESFGRARAATGFSSDLRVLSKLKSISSLSKAILSPAILDNFSQDQITSLQKSVKDLRAKGEIVIQSLGADSEVLKQECCDRQLCWQDKLWQVKPL